MTEVTEVVHQQILVSREPRDIHHQIMQQDEGIQLRAEGQVEDLHFAQSIVYPFRHSRDPQTVIEAVPADLLD